MLFKNKTLRLADSLFSSSLFICSNMIISALVITINIAILGKNSDISLYILSVFYPFSFIISAINESLRVLVLLYSSSEKENLITRHLLYKVISIIFVMSLSVLSLFGIYYFSSESILNMLKVPLKFRDEFNKFFMLMLLVNILINISSTFLSMLLGLGITKKASLIGIVGMFINLLITYLFSNYLSTGVYSLVFSATFGSSFVLICSLFIIKNYISHLTFSKFSIEELWLNLLSKGFMFDLLNKALPIMGSFILIFLYMFSLNYLMSFYGHIHVAALGIGLRIHSIVILPALALGTSSAIHFNKFLSNNEYLNLKSLFYICLWLSLIIYFFITVFVMFFQNEIVSLFSINPAVITSALLYFDYVGPSYFMLGIVLTLMTVYEQTGKGLQMFYLNIIIFSAAITAISFLTLYVKNDYSTIYFGISMSNWLSGFYVISMIIKMSCRKIGK